MFHLLPCRLTESEKLVGTSKFYVGDSNKLEKYFFDLECQMENNKICRDMVCTDAVCEKGSTHVYTS